VPDGVQVTAGDAATASPATAVPSGNTESGTAAGTAGTTASGTAGNTVSGATGGPVPDRGERRRAVALAVTAGLLLAAVIAGVSIGALALPPTGVFRTLLHWVGLPVDPGLSPLQEQVLVELRLPRVLMAALVGGLLSLSGAAYQGVFRNPLADPYLLGAAAGAGLGATAAIMLLPHGGLTVPVAAFVGALTGVGLAYAVGTAAGRGTTGSATLLLAGVAVASFLAAAQTLLLQSHADSLSEVYSWIFGHLGAAQWGQLRLVLPYTAVAVAVLLGSARALDVLSVGDDEAASLGVRPARVRLLVLLGASLGTAVAVAAAGLIGFVGLVVPHLVRRLAGGSHRTLLPVSLLGGATFLVLADLVARTALAPAELPIGVLTAFIGAPFFASLLRRAPVTP
jgi:iron complex transport system permease protein